MKIGIITIVLLLLVGIAQAGDVSCQVDLLKPKMNAAVIVEEANKPATLTVAESRLRLQNRKLAETAGDPEQEDQEPEPQEDTEVAAKSAKKESRIGGIFDILLPAKLRNPVK